MEPAKQTRFERILENLKHMPEEPGCYLMKDKRGKIFYIGKAIHLKNRLRSYFTGQDTRPFVSWLSDILYDIETIVVRNEKEALLLEHTLINEHQPKYNILLKDDKNYILLRLRTKDVAPTKALHERYPRLEVVRQAKADGARYFGPYPSATQIRETLHLINKYFQLRTCSDNVIDNRARPCIQYQIGRCPAPCVYDVSTYRDEMANVVAFLSGHTSTLQKRLKARMWKAAEDENFEQAGVLRDKIEAIQHALSSQAATKVGRGNEDAFALARQGPLAVIAQVMVRKGKLMGTQRFHFDHQEFPSEDLMLNFLTQRYQQVEGAHLPSHIFSSITLPEEAHMLAEGLSARKGAKVRLSSPTKSQPRALLEIAQKNADQALKDHLRREDLHQRALVALQKTLELTKAPRVIECYDVSLFQGSEPVASRVCFVDGVADKSRYRKYNIKTVSGTDDYAMLHEVLMRRLKRGLEENDMPDLLLVDGGKGQLAVALAALKDLKIPISKDGFYVAGIAKARVLEPGTKSDEVQRSSERLFIPGAKDPILLQTHTAERYLIERIRDEAHRFAITAHRSRRSKRALGSVLDDIKGLGPARRKALLTHFGSVEIIKQQKAEDIAEFLKIPLALAQNVLASLQATRLE